MDKYLEQDEYLAEIYNGFSDFIKKIINESNWENEVRRIVEKHGLRIDQGAVIEREVIYIMFGIDEVENFEKNLEKEADIKPQKASEISEDISLKIFEPIMDRLMSRTDDNNDVDFQKKEIHHELPKQNQPENIESSESINDNIIDNNFSKTESQSPKKVDPYLEPIEE